MDIDNEARIAKAARFWENHAAAQRARQERLDNEFEANQIAARLNAKIEVSQRDLIARMSAHDRSVRINEIRNELTVLGYKSFRYDTGDRVRALNAELAILEEKTDG